MALISDKDYSILDKAMKDAIEKYHRNPEPWHVPIAERRLSFTYQQVSVAIELMLRHLDKGFYTPIKGALYEMGHMPMFRDRMTPEYILIWLDYLERAKDLAQVDVTITHNEIMKRLWGYQECSGAVRYCICT